MGNIPYLVTIEIMAPEDIETAVKYAQQGFGINAVESVVRRYRMTNIGTEWYKPRPRRPRSVNPKKRSKNNAKNQMEN